MTFARNIAPFLSAFALIGLLAACAPATTGTPAASSSQPAATQAPAAAQKPAAAPAAEKPVAAQAPRQIDKVKVSLASLGNAYGPILTAVKKGFFEEQGIEVEVVSAPGGTSVPALIGGDLQFNTSTTPTDAAIVKGAPLKIIGVDINKPIYTLYVKTGIREPRDLVGKSIGVNSRGDTFEVATTEYLKKNGISPDQITWMALGAGQGRLAALKSGAVDAAPLGWADGWQMQQQNLTANYSALVKLYELPYISMFQNGVATSDRLIRENPSLVQRFMNATAKGDLFWRNLKNKDEVVRLLQTYQPNRTPEELAGEYDFMTAVHTKDGTISDADVKLAIEQVKELQRVSKDFALADFVDFSFVRKAYAQAQG